MNRFVPGVVVLEKRACWGPELKRQFAGTRVPVRVCRSAAVLPQLLRAMPGSVLVLDFAAGPADGLRLLAKIAASRQLVQPVVIALPEECDLEWPARELGAAAFLTNLVRGDDLAQICRRLLDLSHGSRASHPAPAEWPEELQRGLVPEQYGPPRGRDLE